jgi:hypothetical protein
MKAEFRALELILESPNVYVERREEDNGGNRIDIWDSVHEAMTVLKNKINEVENPVEDTVEPIPIPVPVEAPTMQYRNPETFSKVVAIVLTEKPWSMY